MGLDEHDVTLDQGGGGRGEGGMEDDICTPFDEIEEDGAFLDNSDLMEREDEEEEGGRGVGGSGFEWLDEGGEEGGEEGEGEGGEEEEEGGEAEGVDVEGREMWEGGTEGEASKVHVPVKVVDVFSFFFLSLCFKVSKAAAVKMAIVFLFPSFPLFFKASKACAPVKVADAFSLFFFFSLAPATCQGVVLSPLFLHPSGAGQGVITSKNKKK